MDTLERNALIEDWYMAYSQFIFQYALLFVPPNSARDIVQETFRVVCEAGDLSLIQYPKAWLRSIAKNVLRNWLRERDRWSGLVADDPLSAEEPMAHPEETNIELEYAGAIKEQDLHLLNLLSSGYTYAEAARELQISAEACRKRAKRAGTQLAEKIKRDL